MPGGRGSGNSHGGGGGFRGGGGGSIRSGSPGRERSPSPPRYGGDGDDRQRFNRPTMNGGRYNDYPGRYYNGYRRNYGGRYYSYDPLIAGAIIGSVLIGGAYVNLYSAPCYGNPACVASYYGPQYTVYL